MDNITPPMIINNVPDSQDTYGRIPIQALTAMNFTLDKRGIMLLSYYMLCGSGFSPSTKDIYNHTGMSRGNISTTRKALAEKKYIDYDKKRNTITILWDNIYTVAEAAIELANAGCPNIKQTLSNGDFELKEHTKKRYKKYRYGTIGWDVEHYKDSDADESKAIASYMNLEKKDIPPITKEQEQLYDALCGLTHEEFEAWVNTGLPF